MAPRSLKIQLSTRGREYRVRVVLTFVGAFKASYQSIPLRIAERAISRVRSVIRRYRFCVEVDLHDLAILGSCNLKRVLGRLTLIWRRSLFVQLGVGLIVQLGHVLRFVGKMEQLGSPSWKYFKMADVDLILDIESHTDFRQRNLVVTGSLS